MWEVLNYAAWAGTFILIAWMVYDTFVAVPRNYSEDVLLSSREGVDELFNDAGKGK